MQTEWLLKAVTAAGCCCASVTLACRLTRSRVDLSFSLYPPGSTQSDKTNYCLSTLSDIKPIVVSASKTKLPTANMILLANQLFHVVNIYHPDGLARANACVFEKSLLSHVTIFRSSPITQNLRIFFRNWNLLNLRHVPRIYRSARSKCMIISSRSKWVFWLGRLLK